MGHRLGGEGTNGRQGIGMSWCPRTEAAKSEGETPGKLREG